jgi:hypothetical protein
MGEIDIRFLLCFLEERYIGGGAAVVQTPPKKEILRMGDRVALLLAPGCKARVSAIGIFNAHILNFRKSRPCLKRRCRVSPKGRNKTVV